MSGAFIESKVWNGLENAEMAEINALIGPSLGYSPRIERKERNLPQLHGTVTKYLERGFGWIQPADGSDDMFFHIKDCGGISSVHRGAKVAYDLGVDRKDKPIAVNVQIV